jgi:hypothetical protein
MSCADELGRQLYDAAKSGNLSEVDTLVKRGAPINWDHPDSVGQNGNSEDFRESFPETCV